MIYAAAIIKLEAEPAFWELVEIAPGAPLMYLSRWDGLWFYGKNEIKAVFLFDSDEQRSKFIKKSSRRYCPPSPWLCEKGGVCRYNLIEDLAMDSCIKCGAPLERK